MSRSLLRRPSAPGFFSAKASERAERKMKASVEQRGERIASARLTAYAPLVEHSCASDCTRRSRAYSSNLITCAKIIILRESQLHSCASTAARHATTDAEWKSKHTRQPRRILHSGVPFLPLLDASAGEMTDLCGTPLP